MSITWSEARGLVGAAFEFFPEGAPVTAVVTGATMRSQSRDLVQFAVTFRGPAQPAYRQGTYAFEHPTLGRRDIFITPVARDASGIDYEACFSHAP